MRLLVFALSAVLFVDVSIPARSDTSGQKTKKDEPRDISKKLTQAGEVNSAQRDSRLKQRGIDMIREAGTKAAQLDDQRNAARLQAGAGEALWRHDHEFARTLLRKAFELALARYHKESEGFPDAIVILTRQSSLDLCQEIIRRIGTHDAVLARQLADALTEEKHRKAKAAGYRSGLGFGARSRDSTLVNQMDHARLLLSSDQQAAINEFQRICVNGIMAQRTVLFLWQLALQDRIAADRLFLWLLANICYDNAASPEELSVLVQYVVPTEFVWMAGGSPAKAPKPPRSPVSEHLLLQWYIEASLITLSRFSASDLSEFEDRGERIFWAYYLALWLEPRVAQARPQLITTWHDLVDQLHSRLGSQQETRLSRMGETAKEQNSKWQFEAQPADAQALVQQLIEKAEKASQPTERDRLLQQAALEADRIPDMSWALQIATKVAEAEFRQQVEDWIYFNAATRALSKNDLAEMRRYALAVKAADQSVDLFCRMARKALNEKDTTRARDLLLEGQSQATKADDSPAKVRALASIGNLWVNVDLPEALQTLSSAIETANRVLDYFQEQSWAFHTFGKGPSRIYALNSDSATVELGSSLAALAVVDFDAALGLIGSIKDEPLKLSASIAVGASILDRNRKEPAQSKK